MRVEAAQKASSFQAAFSVTTGVPVSKPKRTTFRAFARGLGVTHGAVSKAAQTGRLSKSIGRDANGRPFIVDAALAAREWAAGATKAPAQPGADVDVEALVFDLVEFVLVNHLPEAIVSTTADGRVDRFDPRALRDWLARRREGGA